MATIKQVELVCDGCGFDPNGSPEDDSDLLNYVTTHTLMFDGDTYEIDLCEPCLQDERQRNQALRPVGKPAPKVYKKRNTAQRRRVAGIRQWARENGHDVDYRGRIPSRIVKAYQEAHSVDRSS